MSGDSGHVASGLARRATASWFREGLTPDTLALLRGAFATDPHCVEAHYGVGLIALASGDLRTAEQAFAHVLALDGAQANAAYHLGVIAETWGDNGEARSFYDRTIVQDPGHQQAAQRLSNLGLSSTRPAPHGTEQ